MANTRRKSLQKDTIQQVTKKLQQLDLSTTSVIVLEDPQWQGGVLGLAAGQIAQEYGRPTVLLSSGGVDDAAEIMARGSARSVNGIDLYQLVKSQSDLLHRFGGHPFAAGLSLPLSNLSLFREGIDQQLRQQTNVAQMLPQVDIDLVVTVADLGQELFDELRQLEPYGMGNPIPKLLIKNCWFKNAWNKNIQDNRGQKVQYIKTTFDIWDDSTNQGFPGIWWGHYKDEIPVKGKCEAIAELDFNTYSKRYEIRLVAVRLMSENSWSNSAIDQKYQVIDRRFAPDQLDDLEVLAEPACLLQQCPSNWSDIHREYHHAVTSERSLVLAYSPDELTDVTQIWQQLVGIAKFLSRTQKQVSKNQLQAKLNLGDRSFCLGLQALEQAGFECRYLNNLYQFFFNPKTINPEIQIYINSFLLAIKEEYFQQQYFYKVPLSTINRQLISN